MQAQKALSKNGKVLGGQFMVGVMACIDRKVMFGATPGVGSNSSVNMSSMTPGGVTNEENTEPAGSMVNKPGRVGFSGSKLDRTQSLRTSTRPLSMMNRAAVHDDSSIDVS